MFVPEFLGRTNSNIRVGQIFGSAKQSHTTQQKPGRRRNKGTQQAHKHTLNPAQKQSDGGFFLITFFLNSDFLTETSFVAHT